MSAPSRPTPPPSPAQRVPPSAMRPLPAPTFASRWLQVPLNVGLIAAQVVHVALFIEEPWHLVEMPWNPDAVAATVQRLGIGERSKETVVMVVVLGLIDVGMISNPLIIKLATAIIGISSIHLRKSSISAGTMTEHALTWPTVIHVVFLVSAVAIAAIDRMTSGAPVPRRARRRPVRSG